MKKEADAISSSNLKRLMSWIMPSKLFGILVLKRSAMQVTIRSSLNGFERKDANLKVTLFHSQSPFVNFVTC